MYYKTDNGGQKFLSDTGNLNEYARWVRLTYKTYEKQYIFNAVYEGKMKLPDYKKYIADAHYEGELETEVKTFQNNSPIDLDYNTTK